LETSTAPVFKKKAMPSETTTKKPRVLIIYTWNAIRKLFDTVEMKLK